MIAANFPRVATLDPNGQESLVADLAAATVAGGAVYDAVIAITARNDGSTLLTRDRRAAATYEALDAEVELLA